MLPKFVMAPGTANLGAAMTVNSFDLLCKWVSGKRTLAGYLRPFCSCGLSAKAHIWQSIQGVVAWCHSHRLDLRFVSSLSNGLVRSGRHEIPEKAGRQGVLDVGCQVAGAMLKLSEPPKRNSTEVTTEQITTGYLHIYIYIYTSITCIHTTCLYLYLYMDMYIHIYIYSCMHI